MRSDPLAARVRDAADAFGMPAMPASTIAARIAFARAAAAKAKRRSPLVAVVGGVAILAAALAVAIPTADKWMTPATYATLKRLTGIDFSHAKSYEVPVMTLEQARRLTTFPTVVPSGKRVLNATPYPHDTGITLIVAVDVHAQAQVNESWIGAKQSKPSKLDGVGILTDGSIRRFNIHRWRIGRIQFSMPMFTPEYRRYALEVERATREAAVSVRPK